MKAEQESTKIFRWANKIWKKRILLRGVTSTRILRESAVILQLKYEMKVKSKLVKMYGVDVAALHFSYFITVTFLRCRAQTHSVTSGNRTHPSERLWAHKSALGSTCLTNLSAFDNHFAKLSTTNILSWKSLCCQSPDRNRINRWGSIESILAFRVLTNQRHLLIT